ncbi:tryptophan--tRNA ligase, mitochondrial [Belonocnema kinseyi]|uniref:tryptophan--tRNA ligase, mitochondrial n=1 Tax=Belonocnema kinseyi TaxID=2817044 RepID=UPI00143D8F64|nr:tryptophan--tRNA ligase, mitochondrial [Belonocnema kinseyi]
MMIKKIINSACFRKSLRFEKSFKEIGRRNYSKEQKISYPKRIFSGIQPTGNVHLGNYLGAIQNWIDLQNSGEDVIWSIVDMHSITLPQDPKELKRSIFSMVATLLACGVDPKKSILFQQSTVPMHAELCWILGSITTIPRLGRLPQYKEKSATVKDVPLALFIYPVLQAADILIYKATHVPVGEDQVQHLELCQDLARKFNSTFGETFPVPTTIISNDAKRIKSLRDPNSKMSKSCPDSKSRLDLIDEPKVLLNKVKKSVTDFTSEVTYDPKNRPGVANLVKIHSLLTGKSPEKICEEAQGIDTGRYKLVLADVVIEKLNPIRERILQLLSEKQYLEQILKEGAEKATAIATPNLFEIREKIGFGNENLILEMPRRLREKRA